MILVIQKVSSSNGVELINVCFKKAEESCGNISEKIFTSINTSSAFILPTTAVSTQGNQQIVLSKAKQYSRIRTTSITSKCPVDLYDNSIVNNYFAGRVVTCGDVSAFDPEESHHKGHSHNPIQTESNQIYFQTEANTGESVYELRMEQEHHHV